ncbi:hypothetical protein K2X92_02935 [Candidatus Gracilibacteria bacterium]|jgi:hypothetical protein|nr:hypothetical protein [Candidatus Gracilibacteria bacterium]
MNQELYKTRILRQEDVESEEKCLQAVIRIIFSALNVDSRLIKEIGSHPKQLKRLSRRFSKVYALGFEEKVTGNPTFHRTVAELGIPVLISRE